VEARLRESEEREMRTLTVVVAAIAAFGVVAAPAGASYLSTKSALEVAKSARSMVAHDQMFNAGWTDWVTKPLVARRVNSHVVDVRTYVEVYSPGISLNDEEHGESVTWYTRVRRGGGYTQSYFLDVTRRHLLGGRSARCRGTPSRPGGQRGPLESDRTPSTWAPATLPYHRKFGVQRSSSPMSR
jgi:hypothetical protein